MIYEDCSLPGVSRLRAKMVSEGVVRFIEEGEIYEEENDKKAKKAVVVIYETEGTPDEPEGIYSVAVPTKKGYRTLRNLRLKTPTAAIGAADALSVTRNEHCLAVIFNKVPERGVAYDAESAYRDKYEDAGVFPGRYHPESNPN